VSRKNSDPFQKIAAAEKNLLEGEGECGELLR
jgi:hypothetical protein